MLRYMLDTNLCIRVLRDRPQTIRERFNAEADGLSISTIVLTELLHGAAKSARPAENRRAVEGFAARLEAGVRCRCRGACGRYPRHAGALGAVDRQL